MRETLDLLTHNAKTIIFYGPTPKSWELDHRLRIALRDYAGTSQFLESNSAGQDFNEIKFCISMIGRKPAKTAIFCSRITMDELATLPDAILGFMRTGFEILVQTEKGIFTLIRTAEGIRLGEEICAF